MLILLISGEDKSILVLTFGICLAQWSANLLAKEPNMQIKTIKKKLRAKSVCKCSKHLTKFSDSLNYEDIE